MTGSGPAPVRVLVADDQRVVREGLATMLGMLPGIEVVAKACDGVEAVQQVLAVEPDVALMDLEMPNLGGIEAMRRIAEQAPGCHVIVLSTYADDSTVLDAIRSGARGYLTKDADAEDIHRAILAVVDGHSQLAPSVQRRLIELVADGDRPSAPCTRPDELPDRITDREGDVLVLVAQGLSNAEIACRLSVSGATVKTHINHLLSKTGCRDRAQLVGYAYRLGLLGVDGTAPGDAL